MFKTRARTYTHLYFHKTLITVFFFPSCLFFLLAWIPSCRRTRASARALPVCLITRPHSDACVIVLVHVFSKEIKA